MKPFHGGSLGRRPWSRLLRTLPVRSRSGTPVAGQRAGRAPATTAGRSGLSGRTTGNGDRTRRAHPEALGRDVRDQGRHQGSRAAIREVLGDDAASPRYIETVGRDGYRFIGAMADPEIDAIRTSPRRRPSPSSDVNRAGSTDLALDRAATGERRIVFVTGEAGIGKTAVIDRFVADALGAKRAWVGRGQCLEQYGAGEPYLPVLEALGELVRDDPANPLALALRGHAPTWASQLPPLGTGTTPASRERRPRCRRPRSSTGRNVAARGQLSCSGPPTEHPPRSN